MDTLVVSFLNSLGNELIVFLHFKTQSSSRWLLLGSLD
jgi:hypothetical protein